MGLGGGSRSCGQFPPGRFVGGSFEGLLAPFSRALAGGRRIYDCIVEKRLFFSRSRSGPGATESSYNGLKHPGCAKADIAIPGLPEELKNGIYSIRSVERYSSQSVPGRENERLVHAVALANAKNDPTPGGW